MQTPLPGIKTTEPVEPHELLQIIAEVQEPIAVLMEQHHRPEAVLPLQGVTEVLDEAPEAINLEVPRQVGTTTVLPAAQALEVIAVADLQEAVGPVV